MRFKFNLRCSKHGYYTTIISIFLLYSVQLSVSVKISLIAPAVRLGESPYWDVNTQKLIYLDVFGNRIMRYDPITGSINSVLYSFGRCNLVIGVENASNQFLTACGHDLNIVSWNQEFNAVNPPFRRLASIYSIYNDSFNDGKCDSTGRFWAGTVGQYDEQFNINRGEGILYSMDQDLLPKVELVPIDVANGLTWNSKENIMYYIDSFSLQIWGFDYDIAHGTISNRRVVFDLRTYNMPGFPDGLTIDTNDNLWLAVFGGGGIANIDPRTGKLLRFIEMPVSQITSVAFGGLAMNVLFVTTSNIPSTAAIGFETQGQPNAGSLFAVEGLGVQGFPHSNFKLINSVSSPTETGYLF